MGEPDMRIGPVLPGARRPPGKRQLLDVWMLICLLLVCSAACRGRGNAAESTEGLDGAAAQRQGWTVRDGDQFSGDQLDPDRWKVYDGPGNADVGLRSPSAVTVEHGSLAIKGREDVSGGVAWRAGPPTTYGRWEFRARSDRGNGYAPAVLLWPDSDRWPQDGEIDIMEINAGDRSSTLISVHWGAQNQQITKRIPGDFSLWHDFALEWSRDHITVYIDGQDVFTTREPAAIPHHPMHLAIQNDVGPLPNWIPPRDASTPPVVGLYVDNVRLYY